MSTDAVITIKPRANRNALTFAIIGSVMLLLTLWATSYWWQEFRLQLSLSEGETLAMPVQGTRNVS